MIFNLLGFVREIDYVFFHALFNLLLWLIADFSFAHHDAFLLHLHHLLTVFLGDFGNHFFCLHLLLLLRLRRLSLTFFHLVFFLILWLLLSVIYVFRCTRQFINDFIFSIDLFLLILFSLFILFLTFQVHVELYFLKLLLWFFNFLFLSFYLVFLFIEFWSFDISADDLFFLDHFLNLVFLTIHLSLLWFFIILVFWEHLLSLLFLDPLSRLLKFP